MRHSLKESRIRKGFTVSQMAEMLNISLSFYYKIEQGIRNPTIGLAKKIADILDETIEVLFFSDCLDGSSSMPTGTAG